MSRVEARMTVAQLEERLRQLPRVALAQLPTPLEEANRLSKLLGGPRILIKRDDLTGLALGGNKPRKLEFLMADALGQGADAIVISAAAQSNMVRMTCAAAAKLGLDIYPSCGGRRMQRCRATSSSIISSAPRSPSSTRRTPIRSSASTP